MIAHQARYLDKDNNNYLIVISDLSIVQQTVFTKMRNLAESGIDSKLWESSSRHFVHESNHFISQEKNAKDSSHFWKSKASILGTE